jgi:hypothetical protein
MSSEYVIVLQVVPPCMPWFVCFCCLAILDPTTCICIYVQLIFMTYAYMEGRKMKLQKEEEKTPL